MSSGGEGFGSLIGRVPAGANSLVVIDAEALRDSNLGIREGWREKNEAAAYTDEPFILPPEADKAVFASEMNLQDGFSQLRKAAVVSLTEPVSMRAIARQEGGIPETVAGRPAVWSPADIYYVQLADQVVGVMNPAFRQIVAKWAKGDLPTIGFGPEDYLATAVGAVGPSEQIIMALDLREAVIPSQASARLREFAPFADDAERLRAVEKLINGIVGVRFAISVDTGIKGELAVDFNDSPAVLGKDGKAMLLGVMERAGVSIASLYDWKASYESTRLVLRGDLTISDLRKILSLLEMPATGMHGGDGELADKDDTATIRRASKVYFSSVSTLIDDLEDDFRRSAEARRYSTSRYFERYAKRIEQLPILNVDTELIDYGLQVSEAFRGASVAQAGINIKTGVRSVGEQSGGGYGYGYDRYGNRYGTGGGLSPGWQATKDTAQRQRVARYEGNAAAQGNRLTTWKSVVDATAEMRVAMTRKYGVEF